jgi:hypothetical protein
MTNIAAITRLNLADALAGLDDDALLSLAYGEFAPTPLLADVPQWLADAAYNEHHRRQFGVQIGTFDA